MTQSTNPDAYGYDPYYNSNGGVMGQPIPDQTGYLYGSGAPPGYTAPAPVYDNQTSGGMASGLTGQAQLLAGGLLGGAPAGAPPGAAAGSTPYYQDPYYQSLYKAKQAYNADPYGNGGYGGVTYYDPWSSGGYTQASPGSGYGSYGGYGMGGAGSYGGGGGGNYAGMDAGSAGVLASGMNAMGNVGAAQAAAVPGTIAANNAPGIQSGINASNQAVASTNAAPALLGAQNQIPLANIAKDTAMGTTGLQTDAQKYAADQQLAAALGVSQNQLQGVLAGVNNQVPLQNAANAVGLANVGLGEKKLTAQQAMFDKLLGSGVLGGGAGGGGTAGGAGGPPLPQSQVVNPLLLQQSINAQQNQNAKRFSLLGGEANRSRQDLATRGMNSSNAAPNSVDGLPLEFARSLTRDLSSLNTDAARQWDLGAAGQNAGQSNNVAQMGLTQYNAAADRALRMQLAAMGLLGNFAIS